MPMDLDGDDGTQQVATVNDYGLEVNFDELEDEETEVRCTAFTRHSMLRSCSGRFSGHGRAANWRSHTAGR